ncbi:Nucleic acid-binding OB-fold [Penicillium cinerascens]|uniref:Nucleic acid-binding OB-fold n=1 Tax=Penicillium cinerascens TaxID=70096 RepID=A0A9W9JE18_9EURO|nr:Nucleic acid-binding OB-fold [Penicillium cinerascens]KAJ5194537.1 Nucleic acid-binding OB-fold [Penicillium cinerascens]
MFRLLEKSGEKKINPNRHHTESISNIKEKKWRNQDLSDLLDTHQDQPTEVRRRDQVKIITTSWTEHADAASSTRASRGGSPNGFTLGHRGHSSHQQGWRFCGSFKELNGGTSTLK